MSDPEVALRELSREKLGIGEAGESPLREGVLTGLATVFGALVPIVPFFFAGGLLAITISFVISMGAHFLVGARAQHLYRARLVPQRLRHVRGRFGRGGHRLRHRVFAHRGFCLRVRCALVGLTLQTSVP